MKEDNQYIESYKKAFKSPVGSYAYLLLNQRFPEMFVISSNPYQNKTITKELEIELQKSLTYDDVMLAVNNINKNLFIDVSSNENEITKEKVIEFITDIKYLELSNEWSPLEAIIEYNNFGPFVENKQIMEEHLIQISEKYALASFNLNPNFKGEEFINIIDKNLEIMCEELNLQHKQIGLDILNLNYQTEEGDFSGYMSYSKDQEEGPTTKMVIKKPEVFAHEWMHFIDSSFGYKDYNITELMSLDIEYLKLLDLDNLIPFKNNIEQKREDYSENDFPKALSSLGHFLEKYALNKKNYYQDLEKIASNFIDTIKDKSNNREEAQKNLIVEVQNLLNPNYPPRYFSFINAQCELLLDKVNKKDLKHNQMTEFGNKADEHLGENGYTISLIETFARTFESYLSTQLTNNNKQCRLVAKSYQSDLYPQGEFKKDIDETWKNSWPQIKEKLDEEMNEKNDNKKSFIVNNITEFRKKINSLKILAAPSLK